MFDDTAAGGKKRLVSGVLAAGLQVGLIIVLVYGLAPPYLRAGVNSALTSLALIAPPLPTPPPTRHEARAAGPASAPARRAKASPFVAPRVVPLKSPPIIPVAPVAGQGTEPGAGAAAAGNGAGAEGQGNGTGAGGDGNGDGGGNGAELVSGRIRPSDTPAKLFDAPFSGTTSALVTIDASGKAMDCRTRRSSGNTALDALTCRLIVTRFRFRPARDPAGRAIAGKIIYEHDWEVGGGFDITPPR